MRDNNVFIYVILTVLFLAGMAAAELKLTGDARCLVVKCVVIKQ